MAAEPEPEATLVGLAGALRAAGLAVPVSAVIAFSRAVQVLEPSDAGSLYWAGRATLVSRPEEIDLYDAVFAGLFGSTPVAPARRRVEAAGEGDEEPAGSQPSGGKPRLTYSARERLSAADFAELSAQEWEEAGRLIAGLRANPELRASRRLEASGRKGRLDLGRTVRGALAHDGEAVLGSYLAERKRPRRIVFLVDISGSMEPYARAYLRLAHAAALARPLGAIEVFALGTRLTRLTRQLSEKDPDQALAEASRAAPDWYGGTRLGAGLAEFNTAFGSKGTARGAIVVICSDGWEQGDPGELGAEMARLARLARRIVWVNPLKASPGYEPLAAGMAAALPHVDSFLAGHSVKELEVLVRLLGDNKDRPRSRVRIS